MDKIDLRSDTVSWPTPAMREAMAHAVVGDDVYGEDPTVNRLEAEAAAMFGKEAGLFVNSGTQGNLVSLLTHTSGRGVEAIMGDLGHTFKYETGSMSAFGGIMPHTIPVDPHTGKLAFDDIRHAVRADNYHFPRSQVVVVENTQGTVGGLPLEKSYMDAIADLAHEYDMPLHVDGARIFNAATALNTTVAELTEQADSLTFCLSKGLCAPVGSIVVGDAAFIKEARRMRKMLGGGMRQAGIVAAAGLIALHEMSQRLQEDHDNAAYLAESIDGIPGITVLSNATNFVFFNLDDDAQLSPVDFQAKLADHDILLAPYPGFVRKYRAVMHYWITRERVEHVAQTMTAILA